MFYSWFFNLFFQAIIEHPRPIAVNYCHMIGIWVNFVMQFPKFGALVKNLGAKHMENLRWFYATSDFDCEYLRNEARYSKSERLSDLSCIWGNKSGELWSTNYKVAYVSLDGPSWTFWMLFFGPYGVLTPQIFTHAKDRSRLASTCHK